MKFPRGFSIVLVILTLFSMTSFALDVKEGPPILGVLECTVDAVEVNTGMLNATLEFDCIPEVVLIGNTVMVSSNATIDILPSTEYVTTPIADISYIVILPESSAIKTPLSNYSGTLVNSEIDKEVLAAGVAVGNQPLNN